MNDHCTLALVSTFPPTRCGLATYAEDLIAALRTVHPVSRIFRVAVSNSTKTRSPFADVTIGRSGSGGWTQAFNWLSKQRVDVILLQHEFKIFGGSDGSDVLRLFGESSLPVVTTLHTVSRRLKGSRLELVRAICASSRGIVVHAQESKQVLAGLGVDEAKIHVIPHGAPALAFQWPEAPTLGSRVRPRFASFGHMRRSKGYELAIDALARLRDEGVAFEYWIYGKNHPRRKSAAEYRREVVARIHNVGLENRVHLVDEYLSAGDLIDAVRACDVGLLPYRRIEQHSSGTLAFFLACGRPVISSNFAVAREVVTPGCGELFSIGNATSLYRKLKKLSNNAELRSEMMLEAHSRAQCWTWDLVAANYFAALLVKTTSGPAG